VDITVKGRHTEITERLRQHVAEKLAKLQRFEHQVTRLDVEICAERNPRQSHHRERVELTCHAKGPIIRAEAAAQDAYAALDLAAARLEARLRRAADRRRVHHGSRTPTSVASATAGLADMPDNTDLADTDADADSDADIGADADPAGNGHRRLDEAGLRDLALAGEPRVVREKEHQAAPMTLEQALFEMELIDHDFFLFVDAVSGLPCVAYRRRGFDYGVIRLRAQGGLSGGSDPAS
jgi:ribosomal subunit interface protein